MKNAAIKVIFVLFIGLSAKAQNIGIGTNSPHASAQLDITAANKGLLIPRMALANRPASPATGLLIYQTNSTPGFYYYNGSSWVMLNFQLPYTGSTSANNALNITSTEGNAIVGASTAASGVWYGGQFSSSSSEGYGVSGVVTHTTGNTRGGLFTSYSGLGVGAYGQNLSLTGSAIGIQGETYSTEGMGVVGSALAATGNTRAVFGANYSSDGVGVAGYAFATTGLNFGVSGGTNSTQGVGVQGSGTSLTGANTGVYGQTNSPDGVGGNFYNNASINGLALKTGQGQVQFDALAGAGNRMVVANASGKLSTQSIPGSQWTTSGNNIYNANSGFVGVGTNTPGHSLHVHHNGEGAIYDASIQLTNSWSGNAANDGLRIRIFNESTVSIFNRENGDISIGTNSGATGAYGTPAIYIKPSGAIGIGTSTPGAKLEILGSGSNQPALNINDGFLKVSGANKTAFTVTGTAGNTLGYELNLNYANQAATDIVIVTHNFNPGGVGGSYHNIPVGVYWTGTVWAIYSEDQATPMLGKSFNVLVIKQ
jgi:hypothetical protein